MAFTILATANLFAQPAGAVFQRLSNEDGLSENSVICMLQDSRGFMWFGTGDGLNRYDGHDFKVFKHSPDDSTSIGSNYILALYEDRDANLWAGAWQGGLNRFDRDRESFVRFTPNPDDSSSLNDNSVLSIMQDKDGVMWFGTLSAGLNRLLPDGETFQAWKHDPDDTTTISDNIITSLAAGKKGVLWIGTAKGGLNRLDTQNMRFRHYRPNPDDPATLSHHAVTAVLVDPSDSSAVWVGTRGGGICRLDTGTGQFSRFRHRPGDRNSLSNDLIYTLFFDHQNNLWAGTFGGGLNRLSDNRTRFITYRNESDNPRSLSDDKVISITEDHAKNLWVGTHKVGINKLTRQARNIRHYYRRANNDHTGLSNSFVTAVYQDKEGTLWVGTQGGLNRYDVQAARFTHYLHNPKNSASLSHNWVSAIFEDNKGNFWVGTYGGGLNRLNRRSGRFHHYRGNTANPAALGDDRVLSINESAGQLWIGTRGGGLNYLNPETGIFRRYLPVAGDSTSISDNIVRHMYPDKDGSLWLATNNGLNHFIPATGSFRHYSHNPLDATSLSDNRILSILIDQQESLWICTMNGLNHLDRASGKFRHYTEVEGLPGNVVYGALQDQQGYIWLSANRGLARFEPRTEQFVNFDASDGLQSNEFNVGAFFKARDGEMFFGGYNGLNAFYPDSIRPNPYPPPVVFTGFRVLNKEIEIDPQGLLQKAVSETEQINIHYDHKVFSFEFAALDYAAPSNNQYAYKMEGFDDSWIPAGNRRFAGYTNLNPGSYRFRVRASNNNGIWNRQGAQMQVYIAPPFWMTWWFRLLMFVALAGLLYTLYRIRVNHLLEVERTRTRIARDLHDDISATLSSITFFGQAIGDRWREEMPEDSRTFLGSIVQGAQEAQDKIRDIIWAINPQHDDAEELLAKCRRYASDLLDSRDIAYDIDIQPRQKRNRGLGMETRQHFWLLFKEMVTNAARHSQAQKIRISIQLEDGRMKLVVEDDGVGFDPSKVAAGTGNGLKNIRSRAQKLDADLSLKTAPGQGTRWQVVFGL